MAFLLIYFGLDLDPGRPAVTHMAAITAWVAIWWFTEPVDLAVTSFALCIDAHIGDCYPGETAAQYMDPIIFLFLGGFILAFAMEKWQLHTRLALGILKRTGAAPSRILAGVMAAAFFLSMWVSNTATVLMLVPAVLSIIAHVRGGDIQNDGTHPIAIALLLGLAYAATMGGGKPPWWGHRRTCISTVFISARFPVMLSQLCQFFLLLPLSLHACLHWHPYGVIRWRYLSWSSRPPATSLLPR